MEFIEGKSLVNLAINTHFSESKIISLIKEVSLLLSYLHNLSPAVIHRDIKPSNIIKRKEDSKKVLTDLFTKITEKEAAIMAIVFKRHDKERANEKKYHYLYQENIRNGKFNEDLL